MSCRRGVALRVAGHRFAVVAMVVAASAVPMACGSSPSRAPTLTTSLRHGPAPSSGAWLGLNDNSFLTVGPPGNFVSRGIVFDRDGYLETHAGDLPVVGSSLRRALQSSVAAGMVPDVLIDPGQGPEGCLNDPNASTRCLPTSGFYIAAYVHGFVATARAVLRLAGRRQVLLEPMNEPWDWASPSGTPAGRLAAAEYAAILAQLLPAARSAGIPLHDIYVPGDGQLDDGTQWADDLYAAQPCLKPGPGTCGPIEGWNLHPYGRPGQTDQGIGSVPGIRAHMLSGEDSIIISEIGFCATTVSNGQGCAQNTPSVVGTGTQTAAWLRETLTAALAMHRQGWLRALLIWDRAGDAWGMQAPDGSLTPQGKVLTGFAAVHSAGRPR